MEAVPIYNVNPAGNSGFNGWEAMALLNNNRNNSNWGDCGGFGGGWWAWIILLFFAFGGWGGGFGGFGNRAGNGCCCTSGIGALGADLAITDATNIAELKAGANYASQTVNGIRNTLSDLRSNLFQSFADTNAAITNAAYQNQLGQREISNAVTNSAYQNQLGQRDIQAAIASCCCNAQQSIQSLNANISQQFGQLNYNHAMQNCELKTAIAAEGAATRALIQAQYTADVERKLAEAKQQLFVLERFGQYAAGSGCAAAANSCGGCGCNSGC